MNKALEEFVELIASNEAQNQLSEIEVNFTDLPNFENSPKNRAELLAAYQEMVRQEDEPWWHCWEMVCDEIPDMIEAGEDEEEVAKQAKARLKSVFDHLIIEGLADYFELAS